MKGLRLLLNSKNQIELMVNFKSIGAVTKPHFWSYQQCCLTNDRTFTVHIHARLNQI